MHENTNLDTKSGFDYITTYYDKGFVREDKKVFNILSHDESVESYAKEVYNNTNNTTRYFVKTEARIIMNPYDGSTRRRTSHNTVKWTKVSQVAFDHYTRFLRTQNKQSLHYAEREI